MNGFLFLAFCGIGAIVVVLEIILMICWAVTKKKGFGIAGLVIVLLFVGVLAKEMISINKESNQFNERATFKKENHQVTILNEGTGSMGSTAWYAIADDSVMGEVEDVYYHFGGNVKTGYVFAPVAEGQTYILMAEYDCGRVAYYDVYGCQVEADLQFTVEAVEHTDIQYGVDLEDYKKNLQETYQFSQEDLDEVIRD